MLNNYFKIAWRNLLKNKTIGFINLFGLAIGMTGVILIGLWVQNEYSFDQFHTNKNELYKIFNRTTGPGEIGVWDVTSGPLGNALKNDFPEIKNTSRIYWSADRLFQFKDKMLKAKGNEVDKPFLTMFTFPLLEGNPAHALDGVDGIVLTEKFAKSLFGNTDALNKIVKVDNEKSYKVTGILKDLPNNTEFNFDYLLSLANNEKFYGGDSWETNTFYTYVQLQANTDIAKFNDKIKNEIKRYSPEVANEIFLLPISKWHLYSRFENGKVAGGRIEIVHLLMLIGALILLIACINFMNLSTAQSQKRAKEVGVRKVIGASKGGLVMQFLCESILVAVIAGILALGVVQLFLPPFNRLIEKSLYISYASPVLWISVVGFVIFTGLLAGSYPVFFLSSFKLIKVLKGSFKGTKNLLNQRKILVILQFSVAVMLVTATLIIYKQVQYVQSRDKGYNINKLVEIPNEGDIEKNYDLIKTELINSGAVTAMIKTGITVTADGSTGTGFKWDGMEKESENLSFSTYRTGGDFIKTMGIKLNMGRDIDFSNFPGDSSSVIVNETAVRSMGIKDSIGKIIMRGDIRLTIVGICSGSYLL